MKETKKFLKKIVNQNSKSTIEVHCTKPHQANWEHGKILVCNQAKKKEQGVNPSGNVWSNLQ